LPVDDPDAGVGVMARPSSNHVGPSRPRNRARPVDARIHQLSRSRGGVPKRPVADVLVHWGGLDTDWQKNRRHHGGPDRAVCLYALERIEALRAEGHPIMPGSVGENVTTVGLDWTRIVPGVRLRLGTTCVLEITSFTVPCRTIRHAFADGRSERIGEDQHPGWSRVYARVLAEGTVHTGDVIHLLDPAGYHVTG
jgi:MOSC domain-containing protein YiiM